MAEAHESDWWDIATSDLDDLPDVEDYMLHDAGGLCRVRMKDGRQFMIEVRPV